MRKSFLLITIIASFLHSSNLLAQENIASYSLLDNGGKLTATIDGNGTLQYLNDKKEETAFEVNPFQAGLTIQYESPVPIVVTSYSIVSFDLAAKDPVSFKLLYSDNGENWTVAHSVLGTSFSNRYMSKVLKTTLNTASQAHKFYKLLINQTSGMSALAISELQLFGFPGTLPSNITGNGGKLTAKVTGDLANLTDKKIAKYTKTGTKTMWIQYESPTPIMLDSYSLMSTVGTSSDKNPRSWELLASNDGLNWTVLDRESNKNFFESSYNLQSYSINQIQDTYSWGDYAEKAQNTLVSEYWNKNGERYFIHRNTPVNYGFNYWWSAHILDVLTDGYSRTGKSSYKTLINNLYQGVLSKNGGTFKNNFYDDMEWMALAFLHIKDSIGTVGAWDPQAQAVQLWNWIKLGWSETDTVVGGTTFKGFNGGIKWDVNQPYKNACSNGPALILASRLYQKTWDGDYLNWAMKIHDWMKDTLIDPETGYVWDGALSKGNVGFVFTYNMGTWMGGCFELFKATNDESYLMEALAAADLVIDPTKRFSSPNGILYTSGEGVDGNDGGLFKGIFMRYLTQMILSGKLDAEHHDKYVHFMMDNGKSLWNTATLKPQSIFNNSWLQRPTDIGCDCSVHVSGTMLLECLDALKREGYFTQLNGEMETNASKTYRYFRLNILSNNSSEDLEIAEWQLFEKTNAGLKKMTKLNPVHVSTVNHDLILSTNEELFFNYRILDLSGKMVAYGKSYQTFVLKGLNSGCYILAIECQGQLFSEKIFFK